MPISRYPRPGHPIAPSLLAPFLQRKAPKVGVRLAELDGGSWERFGEITCRRLGKAVVEHLAPQLDDIVQRLGARRVAPAGSELRRLDLDLEVRTSNCLGRINVDERPDGMADLTIREALKIKAFGIKSLVDLLSSVEAVAGNGAIEAEGLPDAGSRESTGSLPRGICDVIRRSGYIPNSLADLKVPTPAPGTKLDQMGLRVRTLNALRKGGFAKDPTTFGKLTLRQAIRIEGFGVESLCDWIEAVERVERSQYPLFAPNNYGRDESRILLEAARDSASLPEWVLSSGIPPLPSGMCVDELGLHRRTINVLQREGLDDLSRLAQTTIGDVCNLKGFGQFCLLDVLQGVCCVRESQNYVKPSAESSVRDVNETIDAILAIPDVANVSATDPRLGRLLRHIHASIETIGQLSDDRNDLSVFGRADDIKKLRDEIVRCTKLTIEAELTDIVVSRHASKRNRQVVADYYGFGGAPLVTLEVLGERYGVTRERVRQICAPTRIAKLPSPPFAPVLDAALALIRDSLPDTGTNLERQLVKQGMLDEGTSVESIKRIAHVLRREADFQCVGTGANRFLLHKPQASQLTGIEQTARKLVSKFGAAVIDDVLERCDISLPDDKAGRLITAAVGSMKGFRWLNRATGWFWFDSGSFSRLQPRIRKVLSVCGRISIDELRAAIRRDYHLHCRVPPRKILLEICRQMPEAEIEGHEVIAMAKENPADLLRGDEAKLVALLQKHGPICRREQLQSLALDSGMSRPSFWRCLQFCPTISRYGPCVYGLTGVRVRTGEIEAFAGVRRPKQVIQDHGWTAEGDIWIAYRVSQGAIESGVIGVPAAKRDLIQGQFALKESPNGTDVGTLTVKQASAWGLGPFLRRSGGEMGDYLVIVFQLSKRIATVTLGDDGVLEHFQDTI